MREGGLAPAHGKRQLGAQLSEARTSITSLERSINQTAGGFSAGTDNDRTDFHPSWPGFVPELPDRDADRDSPEFPKFLRNFYREADQTKDADQKREESDHPN